MNTNEWDPSQDTNRAIALIGRVASANPDAVAIGRHYEWRGRWFAQVVVDYSGRLKLSVLFDSGTDEFAWASAHRLVDPVEYVSDYERTTFDYAIAVALAGSPVAAVGAYVVGDLDPLDVINDWDPDGSATAIADALVPRRGLAAESGRPRRRGDASS